MVDAWLAGLGVGGKAISTVKNTIMEYLEQRGKDWNSDHAYTILALLGFSPPIGSKARKVYSSIQTERFNRKVFIERGFHIDNPIWSAIGNVIEGVTNIPLGRITQKMLNLDNAMDSRNELWQRVALVLGWNTWDLGIKDPDIVVAKEKIKEEVKEKKKIETKKKKEIKKKEEEIKKIEEGEKKQKQEKKEGKEVTCLSCKLPVVPGKKYCTVHEKVKQRKDGKKVQCKKMKQITKKKTKQCGVMTSNKSGYCYYHD